MSSPRFSSAPLSKSQGIIYIHSCVSEEVEAWEDLLFFLVAEDRITEA